MSRYTKKGQIQMLETIAVLVVFFVLLFIGIYFYFTAQSQGIEELQEETQITSGTVLLTFVPAMPEITCSEYGIPDNCIDLFKLFSFKEHVDGNRGDYAPLFEGFTIRVRMVYPKGEGIECESKLINQMEFPSTCDVYTIYQAVNYEEGLGKKVSTPISLYLPSEDRYIVGKIEVIVAE